MMTPEIVIALLVGFMLGSEKVRSFFKEQISLITQMHNLKKQISGAKADGLFFVEIQMSNRDPLQTRLINYLDAKGMSYTMVASQDLKTVEFSIDMDQPSKVVSRHENVIEVQFGRPSVKVKEEGKVIPFRPRNKSA